MIILENPYADLTGGAWLKGNLHTHTTRSDGSRTQQTVLDLYAERGYGFLSLSDHDTLTNAADYAGMDSHGMIMIPGNEVTANGPHMLHVGAESLVRPSENRQAVIDEVNGSAGFVVVNHPNWIWDYNHCPFERMKEWQGYVGVEVFNGVIERLEGSPYATDKWDRILSTGRRIWGFANDDSHADGDDGLGWNVAYVTDHSPAGVLDALRRGRFYASTGVTIDDIKVDGARVTVTAGNAERISAFVQNGARIAYSDSGSLSAAIPDGAMYIRFECWGDGETQAWTQPLFAASA